MYIAASILGLIVVALAVVVAAGMIFSAPSYRGPSSDHFNGKTFENYDGIRQQGSGAVLRWMLNRDRGVWQENLADDYGPHPLAHFDDGIRITFVNHASFLIQARRLNLLTDPVWSTRVSPVRWAGPKRMRGPGVRLGDVPKVDAVIISHNHYDHLDMETLRVLVGSHHPRIVVPLGVADFLRSQHIQKVEEVDWWEGKDFGEGVSLVAVPAQHFSGRGILDRNATLWCGYVLKTSAGNVYFAGDTGYNERMFREIRERVGPIRVALLPIGAYKPRWLMSPIHVSPREAVQIHKLLEAETSIAMHYGTFALADDGQNDPADDLRTALSDFGVRPDDFLVLREGHYHIWE